MEANMADTVDSSSTMPVANGMMGPPGLGSGRTAPQSPMMGNMNQARPIISPLPGMVQLDTEALNDMIVRQVEWYLGRQNLSSDYFLQQKMDKDNGYWVNLDVIAGFPKMKRLGAPTATQIAECISHRSSEIEVDVEKLLVRPRFMLTEPKRSVLILRDIPNAVPVEEVRSIFDQVNCPMIISIRPDVGDTWFVFFEDEDGAYIALDAIKEKTFRQNPIKARARKEAIIRSPALAGMLPNGSVPPVMANPGPPYPLPYYQGPDGSFPSGPFIPFAAYGPPSFPPGPGGRGFPASAPLSPYGFPPPAGQLSPYLPYEPVPPGGYPGRGGRGRVRGRLSREGSASSASSFGDRSNSVGTTAQSLPANGLGSLGGSPVSSSRGANGKEVSPRPQSVPSVAVYGSVTGSPVGRDGSGTNGILTGRKKKPANRQSMRNDRDGVNPSRQGISADEGDGPDGKGSSQGEKKEVIFSALNFPPLGGAAPESDQKSTIERECTAQPDSGDSNADGAVASVAITAPSDFALHESTQDSGPDSQLDVETQEDGKEVTPEEKDKRQPAVEMPTNASASSQGTQSPPSSSGPQRSYAEILRTRPIEVTSSKPNDDTSLQTTSPGGSSNRSVSKGKARETVPAQVTTLEVVPPSPPQEEAAGSTGAEDESPSSSLQVPSKPKSVWANKPKSVLEASPVAKVTGPLPPGPKKDEAAGKGKSNSGTTKNLPSRKNSSVSHGSQAKTVVSSPSDDSTKATGSISGSSDSRTPAPGNSASTGAWANKDVTVEKVSALAK